CPPAPRIPNERVMATSLVSSKRPFLVSPTRTTRQRDYIAASPLLSVGSLLASESLCRFGGKRIRLQASFPQKAYKATVRRPSGRIPLDSPRDYSPASASDPRT